MRVIYHLILLVVFSIQTTKANPGLSVNRVNDSTTISYVGKKVGASLSASKNAIAGSLTVASAGGKSSSSAAASAASGVADDVASSSASTATVNHGLAVAVAATASKAGSTLSHSTSLGNKTKAGSISNNPKGTPATPRKSDDTQKTKYSIVTKCSGKNEVLTSLRNNKCQLTCANYKNIGDDCKDKPKSGCVCRQGFMRNWKGECVETDSCFSCTGNNERWTDCENDSCQRNCVTFGMKDLFCRPSCNPGCICNLGYLRNGNGECVLATDCEDDVCRFNIFEQYNPCPAPETTCEDILAGYYPYPINGDTTHPDPTQCRPACVCNQDFVRKNDGSCVRAYVAGSCL